MRENFDIYCTHYCYTRHWTILSYATLFIYWMLLLVLNSLYPLQVFGIYLAIFKELKVFWTYYFTSLLLKGKDNFWKVWGIIDRFNKLRSYIASGMKKNHTSQWVPYNLIPPLKEIYHTTHIFLESRSRLGQRLIM